VVLIKIGALARVPLASHTRHDAIGVFDAIDLEGIFALRRNGLAIPLATCSDVAQLED
jgi:hypothetical protein